MVHSHDIRVHLCDDSAAFRALMRCALPDGRLHVVSESGDGCTCVDIVLQSGANAVLLDLAMPHCDGLTAIVELRRRAPHCGVVVFSAFEAPAVAEQCLLLGAHACVVKGAPLSEVRRALREAVAAAPAHA